MIERRSTSRALGATTEQPCTVAELYAIGVPLAGLLGALVAVVLSWL